MHFCKLLIYSFYKLILFRKIKGSPLNPLGLWSMPTDPSAWWAESSVLTEQLA